ncbi:MAG: GNAT family N-acetyltransferase [Bacteroidetes bacterium]|nr:GNAT family N-acetyltransferase [Bacteroidota bacterium]
MSEYFFKQINENSAAHIKQLYKRCFNLHKSIKEIRQKYATDLFGLRDIGFIAYDGKGKPGAYYGVFPITMTIDGNDYLVAQSGDTMTAPEHRKKGLFIDLAKKTYELAKEKNIQFIFGFPNDNSYPGFKIKLDWEFFGSMQDFKLFSKAVPLCEFVSKFRLLKPLYKIYCNLILSTSMLKLDEKIAGSFNHNLSSGLIKKDLNFFKYKSRNTYLIKVNDFIFFVKPETHLIIGDVVFFEEEMTDQFIQTMYSLAKKLGCKRIILSLSKNHWLYGFLKERLASTDELPVGFLRFNKDQPIDQISFTRADYDTF